MNLRAKFDATSFILAGEIRNHTNTQKTNEQTKNKQTNKKAIKDKSTPYLSACVDNNNK